MGCLNSKNDALLFALIIFKVEIIHRIQHLQTSDSNVSKRCSNKSHRLLCIQCVCVLFFFRKSKTMFSTYIHTSIPYIFVLFSRACIMCTLLNVSKLNLLGSTIARDRDLLHDKLSPLPSRNGAILLDRQNFFVFASSLKRGRRNESSSHANGRARACEEKRFPDSTPSIFMDGMS